MAKNEDRVFVRDGRKHFRRTYSLNEVKIGALVVLGLLLVASWVAWMGAHPDPELFKESPGLVNRAKTQADRGPVPEGLAPEGWNEGEVSTFGPENLYEKINGREGFYKSFGFQRLWFVALSSGERSIDLELYDLGAVGNALGAFAGEVPEGAATEVAGDGLVARDRNAVFLVRGRHYVRAIGSDEEEETRAALAQVAKVVASLPGEPLPPSFDLFVGLGVPPGKIAFYPENAFSFGFAKDVHAGLLPDGETELFLVEAPSEAEAQALAVRFTEGFLQYGRNVGGNGGVSWVEDRYLSRVSGATARGRSVIGVRGASDVKAAAALLARLAERVK